MQWYLDACSLLNLCATGHLTEIIRDLGLSIVIIPKVYPGESAYLYRITRSGHRGDREMLVLEPLFESGVLIAEEDPGTDKELERYILYATLMDDGEAATLAVAECRQGGIVTDDFGALKVIDKYSHGVPVRTSLELLRDWAETGASRDVIARAIENMYLRANYAPSRKHPLFGWARSLKSSE